MKTMLVVGALAATFLLTGCANQQGASYGAIGETDVGHIHLKGGKRQENIIGSRVARETRENAEVVKTISRRGYKEGQTEKSGAPLDGQRSGG